MAVLAVQLAPTVLYVAENGRNPEAANRNPSQSEVYGLRLTYLLLPHQEHRIPLLAAVADQYRSFSHDADTEARWSGLGIVGFGGFVFAVLAFLMGWPRGRRPSDGDDETGSSRWWGRLTVAAVLLGTVAHTGAGIHVTAELVRAADENAVWSTTFDGTALDGTKYRDW